MVNVIKMTKDWMELSIKYVDGFFYFQSVEIRSWSQCVIAEVSTVLSHDFLAYTFHSSILFLVVSFFLHLLLSSLLCPPLCCVSTATRVQQDNRRVEVQFHARKKFISLLQHSDRLQGPPRVQGTDISGIRHEAEVADVRSETSLPHTI